MKPVLYHSSQHCLCIVVDCRLLFDNNDNNETLTKENRDSLIKLIKSIGNSTKDNIIVFECSRPQSERKQIESDLLSMGLSNQYDALLLNSMSEMIPCDEISEKDNKINLLVYINKYFGVLPDIWFIPETDEESRLSIKKQGIYVM